MAWDGKRGKSEEAGHEGGGDVAFPGRQVEEGVQGCGSWRMMLTEMEHPSHDGSNWATLKLPICAVCQFLTFDTILLIGEREGDIGSCSELVVGRYHHVREM